MDRPTYTYIYFYEHSFGNVNYKTFSYRYLATGASFRHLAFEFRMGDYCKCNSEVCLYKSNCSYCIKGKAIPLQAWTGPEGSRRLTLPDLKTIGR
jgi:hypothetical protein